MTEKTEKPCICDPNPFQCGEDCVCAGCGCIKERPLLFSAPMVLALLAGSKTQTRRIMKPQPALVERWLAGEPTALTDARFAVMRDGNGKGSASCGPFTCPYGKAGDRLWVKETWRPQRDNQCERITYAADGAVAFENEIPEGWKRPKAAKTGNVSPLFMTRWASRLTLEITKIRVERLQEISAADALAEGVDLREEKWPDAPDAIPLRLKPTFAYELLWERINGKGSWKKNPWVWVVEFTVVDVKEARRD